jgi:hypothetical protein
VVDDLGPGGAHRGDDLVVVGRVRDQEPALAGEAVDEQVLLDAAALVQQVVVLGAADVDLAEVVGQQTLQRPERRGAHDVDLAEVAEVEQADALAYRAMLGQDAPVLDGHQPAAERPELGPEAPVQLLQRPVPRVRFGHGGVRFWPGGVGHGGVILRSGSRRTEPR